MEKKRNIRTCFFFAITYFTVPETHLKLREDINVAFLDHVESMYVFLRPTVCT